MIASSIEIGERKRHAFGLLAFRSWVSTAQSTGTGRPEYIISTIIVNIPDQEGFLVDKILQARHLEPTYNYI